MPKLTTAEKKKRAKLHAKETRRDKFERLASRRVNRAMTAIRLLGNLASSNYAWDMDDIKHIRTSLIKTIETTMQKFEARRPTASSDEFSFKSRRPSADAGTDWEHWKDRTNQPDPQAA